MVEERYRLTLEHFAVDDNGSGSHYWLEDPLVVQVYLNPNTTGSVPFWLDSMLDKMKQEVLLRYEKE